MGCTHSIESILPLVFHQAFSKLINKCLCVTKSKRTHKELDSLWWGGGGDKCNLFTFRCVFVQMQKYFSSWGELSVAQGIN